MRKVAARRLLGRDRELAAVAAADGVILIEGAAGGGETAPLPGTPRPGPAARGRGGRGGGAPGGGGAHIGGRLEGIEVVIQVAPRPHEGSALPPSALAQLAGQSGTEVLQLSPLSTESTAALVREALGGEVSNSVCVACHSATGGNAFYLRELLTVAAEESLTQADDAGDRIAGLVPDRVRRVGLL